ncbi:PTS sugar transporter subunit IIB [Vagococcus salmoninarum]|uniref:PTS mannose transporter subunit IIA n=1 Tax=Vagococcus salmoninarum TaxID=2739 RepID=A0A429ZD25_9ENTE|nr:PTS sugar transporter subunit IIB [Vagococcus salmoninarum]MBE9387769.1 PTS sugar transporter subunit IIB [Vagococcus salmoninarum]RST91584.1 PTS mannose transporter subunit IIA [Vagococcus salmoninarum]
MRKKLIVACGSGVATSTMIAEKVKTLFEKDQIKCEVEAVDYKSILSELKGADIYLYIAQPDQEVLQEAKNLNILVLPGVPFLTGMGVTEVYERIVAEVN